MTDTLRHSVFPWTGSGAATFRGCLGISGTFTFRQKNTVTTLHPSVAAWVSLYRQSLPKQKMYETKLNRRGVAVQDQYFRASLVASWYSYLHWYSGRVSYLLLSVFKALFVALTREREKAFVKYNRNRSYTSRQLRGSERPCALLLVSAWHLFIHSPASSSSSSSLPPPQLISPLKAVHSIKFLNLLLYEPVLHNVARLEAFALKYWCHHRSNYKSEAGNEPARHAHLEKHTFERRSLPGTEPIPLSGAAGGLGRAGRRTGQDLRKVWESIVVYSVLKSK